jgi:Spy/CpxP family protein refolding chaperone
LGSQTNETISQVLILSQEGTMSTRAMIGLTAVMLATAAGAAVAGPPVPPAFKNLKPFQVVEQVMGQRQALNLTDAQFTRLDDLSLAIRSEKHRFTHEGGKPHTTRHVPMVSRQKAYEQALAILTPDQQARLQALFPPPATKVSAPRKLTVPHGKP